MDSVRESAAFSAETAIVRDQRLEGTMLEDLPIYDNRSEASVKGQLEQQD